MDYKCTACNYSTKKRVNWSKHLITKKHLSKKVYLCECGKQLQSHGGLWKHRQTCNKPKEETNILIKQMIEAHRETHRETQQQITLLQQQITLLINKVEKNIK